MLIRSDGQGNVDNPRSFIVSSGDGTYPTFVRSAYFADGKGNAYKVYTSDATIQIWTVATDSEPSKMLAEGKVPFSTPNSTGTATIVSQLIIPMLSANNLLGGMTVDEATTFLTNIYKQRMKLTSASYSGLIPEGYTDAGGTVLGDAPSGEYAKMLNADYIQVLQGVIPSVNRRGTGVVTVTPLPLVSLKLADSKAYYNGVALTFSTDTSNLLLDSSVADSFKNAQSKLDDPKYQRYKGALETQAQVANKLYAIGIGSPWLGNSGAPEIANNPSNAMYMLDISTLPATYIYGGSTTIKLNYIMGFQAYMPTPVYIDGVAYNANSGVVSGTLSSATGMPSITSNEATELRNCGTNLQKDYRTWFAEGSTNTIAYDTYIQWFIDAGYNRLTDWDLDLETQKAKLPTVTLTKDTPAITLYYKTKGA